MKRATPNQPTPKRARREPGRLAAPARICFQAILLKPAEGGVRGAWSFLRLPPDTSTKLPSRGMVAVRGTFNGVPFLATLNPDGQGGHWLKVERKLREAAGAKEGDTITLEIQPTAEIPEPEAPPDLQMALRSGPANVRTAWRDITPAARRDFIHWITSPKRAETRVKRIESACDMLAKGKRRPCCFDRSGMYSQSLSCPVAEEQQADA